MTLTKTPRKPRKCRRRPRLECLETRYLLSVSSDPGLINPLTDPSSTQDGSDTTGSSGTQDSSASPQDDSGAIQTLPQSPHTINVVFYEPIDPFSIGGMDFDLLSVAPDGTTTSLSTPTSPIVTEPTDVSAPTDTLVLQVNRILPNGHYRLVLLGHSTLTGEMGDPFTDGVHDVTIIDFKVQAPLKGVKLSDAKNIGIPTADETVVNGQLNFATNPVAVNLYKFTLPTGHFWLTGLEISATRDGGTLQTALTLFNSKGKVIATSTIGNQDFPLDPYLFQGLVPGTYYIGVSDAKNIPGQSGGYDPVKGTPGSVSQDKVGGVYRLHVIATAADDPVKLTGSQLAYIDPLSKSPSGISLSFSGSVSLDTFRPLAFGKEFAGLELVDQDGKSWGITPVGFANSQTTINFIFDDQLPAGDYTLRIPQTGGLTDLAGLTPVAPGEPAGVLTTFTVEPQIGPTDPNNLGVFTKQVEQGIGLVGTLTPTPPPPGSPDGTPYTPASTTYRFVVPVGDFYQFEFTSSGAPITAQLTGPSGTIDLSPTISLQQLLAGGYTLKETTTGTEPVEVHTFIKLALSSWEAHWNNGIAQGPSLNVALVAPSTPDPTGGTTSGTGTGSSSGSGSGSGSGSSGPFGPGSGSSSPAQGSESGSGSGSGSGSSGGHGGSLLSSSSASTASAGSGLILTLGTLVGGPSGSSTLSVVGPGVQTGTTALAFNGVGVPQGINYGFSSFGESTSGEGGENVQDPEMDLEPVNGAIPIALQLANTADDRAEVDTEWPTRTGDILARWFSAIPGSFSLTAPDAGQAAGDVPPRLAARIEPKKDEGAREENEEVEQTEQAGIAVPLGMGLATVLLLKLRQPIRRWYARHNAKARQRNSQHAGAPYARA